MKKLIVFGLDCADPKLVFEDFVNDLPCFKKIINNGIWGNLKSTIPPITVPAWTSMTTGKDPGELGLYGFRNRQENSYELSVSNNSQVKDKRVWDILNEKGYRSIVVGVPQTFPPKIENGILISGFMTPSEEFDFTYPIDYKEKIKVVAPNYKLDVKNFRIMDKDLLLKEIREMTVERFKLIRHLIKNENWDFLMMVEIGLDRMHHVFWSFMRGYETAEENESYKDVIFEYYKLLDKEIELTINSIDEEINVLIVSDHGAKDLKGGFCINEWLIKEGFLKLQSDLKINGITNVKGKNIDWSKTKAWGTGGYYGRIFLNVEGRDPNGIIKQNEYKKIRNDIKEKLLNVKISSKIIKNKVFYPEDIYKSINGLPPDLLVYFDDLNMRSIGSIGYDSIFTLKNDEGVDTANHAENGLYIYYNSNKIFNSLHKDIEIYDIFQLILFNYRFQHVKSEISDLIANNKENVNGK